MFGSTIVELEPIDNIWLHWRTVPLSLFVSMRMIYQSKGMICITTELTLEQDLWDTKLTLSKEGCKNSLLRNVLPHTRIRHRMSRQCCRGNYLPDTWLCQWSQEEFAQLAFKRTHLFEALIDSLHYLGFGGSNNQENCRFWKHPPIPRKLYMLVSQNSCMLLCVDVRTTDHTHGLIMEQIERHDVLHTECFDISANQIFTR